MNCPLLEGLSTLISCVVFISLHLICAACSASANDAMNVRYSSAASHRISQPEPHTLPPTPLPPLQQQQQQNFEESTATVTTRLDFSLQPPGRTTPGSGVGEPSDLDALCPSALLQPSTSNHTTLSGNDYVEVMTHGETRPLRKASTKSATSQGKPSAADGFGHNVEVLYNPYDNIPELGTDKCGKEKREEKEEKEVAKKEGKGEEKWRKSGTPGACCDSEFVDFFDHMQDRRGSVRSSSR